MSFRDFVTGLLSRGGDEPQREPVTFTEKRRSNRFDLNQPDEIHLEFGTEGQASPLKVLIKNISLRGCQGTVLGSGRQTVGDSGEGVIIGQTFSVSITLEVVRFDERDVAFRFKAPFPRELERLEKFLEPRCLGTSMREIDQESLQQGKKQDLRWFQGINDTNLFSWSDPQSGEIVQQQLVYMDHVVEWAQGKAVKTGRIKQDTSTNSTGVGWVKSDLLNFDGAVNQAIVDDARAMVESSRIDASIKEAFLKNLRS